MKDFTTNKIARIEALPKVARDGLWVTVLLSFLSTAGLFYVNLGGAFLSAFVDGLGLSLQQAGYITSANKYGAAFGALLAALGARYLPWRLCSYCALLGLITVDLLSFSLTEATTLIAVRFLHGSIGGFLVGMGFSVIARTANPDRVFGMLLAIQYSFGSLGIWLVPGLVAVMGSAGVFIALICFSLITLFMVSFIPDYPPRALEHRHHRESSPMAMVLPLSLALLALFLFQAANMGFADYALELGKFSGFTLSETSDLLALANMIGISGGVLVYWIGTRWGRVLPIMLGLSLMAVATYMMHWSSHGHIYFLGNAVTGVMWGFIVPYLFGICSTFDSHGQIAALSGFVSKMGLASGPMMAATVIGTGNFAVVINLAVVGLILCGLSALLPAWQQDQLLRREQPQPSLA